MPSSARGGSVSRPRSSRARRAGAAARRRRTGSLVRLADGVSTRAREALRTIGRLPECDVVVGRRRGLPAARSGSTRAESRGRPRPTWARRTGRWSTANRSRSTSARTTATASRSARPSSSSGAAERVAVASCRVLKYSLLVLALLLRVPRDPLGRGGQSAGASGARRPRCGPGSPSAAKPSKERHRRPRRSSCTTPAVRSPSRSSSGTRSRSAAATDVRLRLQDTYVSQVHARLSGKDGAWYVEDQGSTNGTLPQRPGGRPPRRGPRRRRPEGRQDRPGAQAMKVRVGATTDIGRVREGNEDSYLVLEPLYAVADGMGGHRGGEVASSLALETIRGCSRRREGSLAEQVVEANRAVVRTLAERPERLGHGDDADRGPGRRQPGASRARRRLARVPAARRRARAGHRGPHARPAAW